MRDSRSARGYFANEKLERGLVGLSGRGQWFVETMPRIGEDVVALCDVNQRRAADAFKKFPGVRQFKDFRKMLDEMEKQIDAVFVATPDNTHGDLGRCDAGGEARVLREAVDARRGRGPARASSPGGKASSRRWGTRGRRPRLFAGRSS